MSSTRIRECLACGRTEEAAGCLGRPYAIEGTVIRGMHLASSLGFPTANIRPDPGKLLPRYGVYRVFCVLDNVKAAGMANIGVKPTVTSAGEPLLEVFFPGFSGDLYGRTLHVEFDSFIRPEKKFASAEELKKQISEDLKRI